MKKFLIILLLIPSLSWGAVTFKNGKIQDGEIPGKPFEVFLKENAGLDKSDTTINIIGGVELHGKFDGRYDVYKKISESLDYNILEIEKNDTRFGETALRFKLGKECVGIVQDCERSTRPYSRVEFEPIRTDDMGRNRDNVWASFSFKIFNDPNEWSDYVNIQQWQNAVGDYSPMFRTVIIKDVGLILANETSKGYKVIDYKDKRCLGGGSKYGGSSFCVANFKEYKLLDWNELIKRKWVDVVYNIKFHDDPNQGYFKVWINGELILDEKGQTIWKTYPGVRKETNRWTYNFGIYTSGVGFIHELLLDEVSVSRSCDQLKLENLNYDCQKLLSQTTQKKEPYTDNDVDYTDNDFDYTDDDFDYTDENNENNSNNDEDIINLDQNNYEIEWTLEEVGNLDSKKIIAKDVLTFDSNIGSIIEFGDDEYLSKDIRTKFNYELVDRIINISGNFVIEGFDNKELLLQLLKSAEIFKGEKRLNDKKGQAHKVKVKIKKI